MGRKTFRRVIVTPELLEQVNKENIKLRDQFLKEKKTRSSETTINGYLSDINIFSCWSFLYCSNKSFFEMKKLDFSDFFGFCVDELKFGSARFGRMKSCLSSLSNFVERFLDDEYPSFRNIILKSIESMPKNPTREKTILSESKVNEILQKLEEDKEYQLLCWFALAVCSGARFSELLRFTVDLINPDKTAFEGIFLETTKAIRTKGRGRNGKQLVKYILKDEFINRYNLWLEKRQEILNKTGKIHEFLFIKRDGSPADESTARGFVNKLQSYLDVPLYAHALRHFLVTKLFRVGFSSELIQAIMGWTSESMPKVYNDLTAQERVWPELKNLKSKPEDNSSN